MSCHSGGKGRRDLSVRDTLKTNRPTTLWSVTNFKSREGTQLRPVFAAKPQSTGAQKANTNAISFYAAGGDLV